MHELLFIPTINISNCTRIIKKQRQGNANFIQNLIFRNAASAVLRLNQLKEEAEVYRNTERKFGEAFS